MKIIFLGLMFCEESLASAIQVTKCGIQYAPHFFQKNLLEGFSQMEDIDLHVLNVPPTGSYPMNSRELFSKSYHWGEKRKQISFVNLPVLKHLEQKKKLLCACREIICKTNEPVSVIIYSPYGPFLDVCNRLKKEFDNVSCCMILTDVVPGRGDLVRFMSKKAVKKGDAIVKKCACFDSFVVLTKYLAESVEAGDRPFTIIECVCNDRQAAATQTDGSKNVALYAGTLEKEYGILDMAKAFALLENAQLRIYGRGGAEEELKSIAATSDNVKFFGFADQATIEKERNACDFLINPRRPTGTFTKYSFPSKTAEYMVSGKPVLMYKLEGVPDDYDQYLNYLSAETPEEIARQLQALFSQPYDGLLEKAHKGRDFMLQNKSSKAQGEKIKHLLSRK